MHGWAVTIDYRPGKLDNKNDLDDLSGLAPEYVLTDYYYQVLAAKKATALAGKPIEDEPNNYRDKTKEPNNYRDKPTPTASSAANPLTGLSGSFYPYNALAHRNISPERASREALLVIGAALMTAPFILEFWPVFIRLAPTIIRTLPKIKGAIPKAPLPPASVAPMIKGIPGS